MSQILGNSFFVVFLSRSRYVCKFMFPFFFVENMDHIWSLITRIVGLVCELGLGLDPKH